MKVICFLVGNMGVGCVVFWKCKVLVLCICCSWKVGIFFWSFCGCSDWLFYFFGFNIRVWCFIVDKCFSIVVGIRCVFLMIIRLKCCLFFENSLLVKWGIVSKVGLVVMGMFFRVCRWWVNCICFLIVLFCISYL